MDFWAILQNSWDCRGNKFVIWFFFLQEFREPKLDSQIVTKFLPALMSLMVDDQVRMLNSKLPPDERESAITIIEHSGKVTYSYCI